MRHLAVGAGMHRILGKKDTKADRTIMKDISDEQSGRGNFPERRGEKRTPSGLPT
jgi:hypothetical protein